MKRIRTDLSISTAESQSTICRFPAYFWHGGQSGRYKSINARAPWRSRQSRPAFRARQPDIEECVCRQRRLAVGFPAAFSGLFRMACLDHERNLLDYIRHAGAVSCQDFLQFPKGVTALHREIAGIHDFPSFLMRGNPAVPWFEAITDQNTRSYETPSRHGALVSEIRKLLMPVYVAEIEGFSVLAFHEDDDTGAERTASSEPFRAFISRLKHGGSGQPAWNRSSELHVRRALKDERDAWQAAHEIAIAAENARSDEMDFFAIFLPFVDPAA